MTATPARYRSPFISQKRKDKPPYDDCSLESGLMLLGAWTLGDGLRMPSGELRDLHGLSVTLRRRIGEPSGGLTLAQVDEALHTIDPELPPLPRYPGQNPAPVAGATLRLDWRAFRRLLEDGHAAILLGYQPGASIGHAIHVCRGTDKGALVMDPWLVKPLAWDGDVWDWQRLRAFTERRVGGHRFGSDDAVACAVVPIGAESEAARAERRMLRRVDRAEAREASAVTAKGAAESALAEERAAHTLTRQQLAACEERAPEDCGTLRAERDGALERARQEQERANVAVDHALALEERIARIREIAA